ncbi:Long-chain fatty acid transport protein [Bryocella elongata]|uniref:Long-chain fatty acid transport protein n=1 Tax=Bryocella elongata TaxID=863522 RepID=A0A1H5T2S9_9BACT|nr:outer membrane protein transport protein [Bryocella elongata]SEF57089.1 Long-chain fatty acid transport protein [Bryocella elongata]
MMSIRRLAALSFVLLAAIGAVSLPVWSQSSSLGHGLSAAAEARGGAQVADQGSPIDAIESNPAGLTGIHVPVLEGGAIGVFGSGSFQNSANTNGRMSGVVGAMPYGAFVRPVGDHGWDVSVGFTPEILMRANWRYVDAPGTAGVSYGLQTNEDEIIAVRTSVGVAHTFGPKWSAGAVLGVVYNQNNLNAPYIFQQQPQLAGLKVLLDLGTHGYGWNGNAGVQWQPNSRLRVGLAWKSETTIHTHGDANGSASALFTALGVSADPTFHYQAQVLNKLPQAFDTGFAWRQSPRLLWQAEGDFVVWGQAFQQLPVALTGGTNAVINSVVGSSTLLDAVPLYWNNQTALHIGVESPISESTTLRAGYSFMTNPVPSSTLLPMTAAILQNSLGVGGGWTHGRLRTDLAYSLQFPASESVGKSGILSTEYDNSKVRLLLQSVTLTTRYSF